MRRRDLAPVDFAEFDAKGNFYHRASFSSAAPAQKVWDELHCSQPLHWCSSIRSIAWDPATLPGVGAQRVARLGPGLSMSERYIFWTESDHLRQNAFTVESTTVPGVRRFGERYTVVPSDDGGSQFVWEFIIELAIPAVIARPGLVRKAVVAPNERDTARYLTSLQVR